MMTRSLTLLSSLLVVFAVACGGDSNNNGSCGDGHVTGSETCDDGNKASGDGCSATCKLETTCGNGVVEVSMEQCDDGNTTNGDGCSSTCMNEGGTCGNGVLENGETCDDGNTATHDGCSATCATEMGWTCTGMPSVCTSSGGGTCSAPSTIALTAMGTDLVGSVTGDTTNATNGIDAADCNGDVAGAGNDNLWKFTLTDTRDVLIEMQPDTNFDGGIRLMSTACDTATDLADQQGDGCSDGGYAGDPEYLAYVNLAPGTYYLSVDGYDTPDAGTYTVNVTASMPTCGDGSLGQLEWCDDGNTTANDGCTNCKIDPGYNCDTSEPSVCKQMGCGDGIIQVGVTSVPDEACDDGNKMAGDGCDATCQVETNYTCEGEPSICKVKGCGNGYIEDTEECDDGNLTSGDRCSSTCVLEQDVTEAAGDPNNSTPQALTAGNHIVRGAFEDGDVDLYTFTLATASKVQIETYSTINGTSTDYQGVGNPLFDCLTDEDDTELAIFPQGADTTDDTKALFIDDDDGDHYCSYLGPNDPTDSTQLAMLAAGTYTIRVQPSSLATTIPTNTRYMLDLTIGSTSTGPVAPAAGDLKINEFLAADGGSTNGGVDSNCDGVLTNSDDEFIELVNVSNKTLDLTGVTYADTIGVKFTFAPQTTGSLTLEPGKAVVIWGGGAPACPGVTDFFTNGTAHTLSLNDAGDTITIATGGANPVTIASTTYGAATIGTSFNLNPDVTGTAYALHSAVTGHVGNYSPGKKADGSAF